MSKITSKVRTTDTRIDPRHPSFFEKKKNMPTLKKCFQTYSRLEKLGA